MKESEGKNGIAEDAFQKVKKILRNIKISLGIKKSVLYCYVKISLSKWLGMLVIFVTDEEET